MDNSRKNRWRRAESARVREQRIISGYVELKYPEVYKEAAGFYNLLNEKYPTKNDLRKTNEYEWLKTDIPNEITKKYYKRKDYPNIKKRTTVDVQTHNPRKECSDNMQLVIPLMESITTAAQESQSITKPAESGQESQSITQPAESGQESQSITQPSESPNESAAAVETTDEHPQVELAETIIDTTNSFMPTLNDEIPDNILEEIMAGLRQDPYLEEFFSNIEIDIDETSPLERELESW